MEGAFDSPEFNLTPSIKPIIFKVETMSKPLLQVGVLCPLYPELVACLLTLFPLACRQDHGPKHHSNTSGPNLWASCLWPGLVVSQLQTCLTNGPSRA